MKYRKKIFFFTLIAMNLVDQPAPEVKIEQGILSGKISEDGSFFEYIGIPYGTANKTNRFKAPFPPPSWEGVYKATEEYTCPQNGKIFIIGTEDCLKVNVYVPVIARKPLPVMVFIHGGAFEIGSGGKLAYGPEFLIKHDVILVTLNYRLGALGFTCLGIKEAPGNAGIQDQIAALRWIKKNIAAFGGNPDNVTIFGMSAGATCTSLLMAIEATKGLFKRAIVQSGSGISHWAINRDPVLIASILAKELGYDTNDPHNLYRILSEAPYKQLIGIDVKRPLNMFENAPFLHGPCVEKPLSDVEAVMTKSPYHLLSKPINIPVLYGSTSEEGILLLGSEDEKILDKKKIQYLFASDLEFKNENETASVNKRVKDFYFGNEQISMKNILNLKDFYTDLYIEMPVILESELLIANSNAPVYNYYFDYYGGRNFLKDHSKYRDVPGACHGDELLYIFNGRYWPFKVSKKDQLTIDRITTMWTNFAKYGDPTPLSDSNLLIKWTPSNKDELKFLYIEDELRMGPIPNPERHQLWKDIYSKYRRSNYTNY